MDAGPHAIRVDTPAGWRAFGTVADLDLDFASDDRPAVVTALLAACAAPRDSAYWWSRSVGERIAAILRLLVISTGVEALALHEGVDLVELLLARDEVRMEPRRRGTARVEPGLRRVPQRNSGLWTVRMTVWLTPLRSRWCSHHRAPFFIEHSWGRHPPRLHCFEFALEEALALLEASHLS